MTELCTRYGISRPTGYKWVTRHQQGGVAALIDRSHASHTCPHRLAGDLAARILAARRQYGWGATISTGGTFSWEGRALFVSEVLRGQDIALEEIDDGLWNLVYYPTFARPDRYPLRPTQWPLSAPSGVNHPAGLC